MSADGSMIVGADPASARIAWNLHYNELSLAEVQAIHQLYTACSGPFSAFTFVDPADNMLAFSSDLTNAVWPLGPNINMSAGVADPLGGTAAFTATNMGQVAEAISQTIAAPANYQYCFSVYVQSTVNSGVMLGRAGSTATVTGQYSSGPSWNRIISAGRLNDPGTTLTVSVQLQPGQSIQLFGPQLEGQTEPSSYRSTTSRSGVYPNSHWASNQLIFSANGPNSFSSLFSIESAL